MGGVRKALEGVRRAPGGWEDIGGGGPGKALEGLGGNWGGWEGTGGVNRAQERIRGYWGTGRAPRGGQEGILGGWVGIGGVGRELGVAGRHLRHWEDMRGAGRALEGTGRMLGRLGGR